MNQTNQLDQMNRTDHIRQSRLLREIDYSQETREDKENATIPERNGVKLEGEPYATDKRNGIGFMIPSGSLGRVILRRQWDCQQLPWGIDKRSLSRLLRHTDEVKKSRRRVMTTLEVRGVERSDRFRVGNA
jgi:hypothetical protein